MFSIYPESGQNGIIRTFFTLNMSFIPLFLGFWCTNFPPNRTELYWFSSCWHISKYKIKFSVHKMLGKNMGNRAFFIAQLKCIKSFEPEEVITRLWCQNVCSELSAQTHTQPVCRVSPNRQLYAIT